MLIFGRTESRSAAAGPSLHRRRCRCQRFHQLAHLGQGIHVQGVVHPTSLASVGDQSGILQHFQVEGQSRLGGIEGLGEIADAALASAKALQDREPGLVRESVKQDRRSAEVDGCACGHGDNISIFLDLPSMGRHSLAQAVIGLCPSASARLSTARPRWLTRSFSSGAASPKLFCRSSLKKYGSYPNPPVPAGCSRIRPAQLPSKLSGTDPGPRRRTRTQRYRARRRSAGAPARRRTNSALLAASTSSGVPLAPAQRRERTPGAPPRAKTSSPESSATVGRPLRRAKYSALWRALTSNVSPSSRASSSSRGGRPTSSGKAGARPSGPRMRANSRCFPALRVATSSVTSPAPAAGPRTAERCRSPPYREGCRAGHG